MVIKETSVDVSPPAYLSGGFSNMSITARDKIPGDYNPGAIVPKAKTIHADPTMLAASYSGTYKWTAIIGMAAAQLFSEGSDRIGMIEKFSGKKWKASFVMSNRTLFEPDDNNTFSPIQFELAVLYHDEIIRLSIACLDQTLTASSFELLNVTKQLSVTAPNTTEGYCYSSLFPHSIRGELMDLAGPWPSARSLVVYLMELDTPIPGPFLGTWNRVTNRVHISNSGTETLIFPGVKIPPQSSVVRIAPGACLGGVSSIDFIPNGILEYHDDPVYADFASGYCYLNLVPIGRQMSAMAALMKWPTIGSLVDWSDQLKIPIQKTFKGFLIDGRIHITADGDWFHISGTCCDYGDVVSNDDIIGGDHNVADSTAHVEIKDTETRGHNILVRYAFSANSDFCVSLEDIVARNSALSVWSSVILTGVQAAIESVDGESSINFGLSHTPKGTISSAAGSISRRVTKADVTFCNQRMFAAAATANAGGAQALLVPNDRTFDLELSQYIANYGPKRPHLVCTVFSPNNEIITLDILVRVENGAIIRGNNNDFS